MPDYNLDELSIRYPAEIILQDLAIFSAVSSLSPVSIINLIFPCLREWIVSGTKSWSLSSIPVAPNSVSWF